MWIEIIAGVPAQDTFKPAMFHYQPGIVFMSEDDERVYRRLKVFNLVMGFFHLVQGVLMVVLSNDFTITITRGFLDFNTSTQTLEPESAELFEIRLGLLVASFLFMSALAHLLIGTVLFERYKKDLKKGMNRYRWYEYAFSSSVMIVAIAMLTGIYDIGALLVIFFLNMMMIFFGLVMEKYNQFTKKTDWAPFVMGCIAGIVPWVAIAISLLGAGGGDGGPPDFVYGIYVSIAIFFNCFAVNMVLQYKEVWKWRSYLFGEWMYVVLSLVAKSLLAWQVFAGTLRPD
jgi:hypothetical protein